MASTLIGATTLAQLQQNIDSLQVTLTDDLLAGIEALHERFGDPAP